jgi:hypothetical protein
VEVVLERTVVHMAERMAAHMASSTAAHTPVRFFDTKRSKLCVLSELVDTAYGLEAAGSFEPVGTLMHFVGQWQGPRSSATTWSAL